MASRSIIIGVTLIIIGLLGVVGLTFFRPIQIIDINAAENIAKDYLASLGISDLRVKEIMEFQLNYYIEYIEHSTGFSAFEMLINKQTGSIYPEYGPNMMWNLKYSHSGMMGGWATPPSTQMKVTPEQAKFITQNYLNNSYPGTVAEEVNTFYGYYSIHITKNGVIFGMLSVNGGNGLVWFHSWHGNFIQSRELE